MTCEYCKATIIGTMVGCGDGSGQRFMHRECYVTNDAFREAEQEKYPSDYGILEAEEIE
jgi:hypothetical protein